MTIHILILSTLLSSLFAQDPAGPHSTTPPATNRTTVSPTEFLKQKENAFRKQEEELKIKEGNLDSWQEQLDKAKNSQHTAEVNTGLSVVAILASAYLGGKILKMAPPVVPAKRFLSLDYARQVISKHPKFAAGTFWTFTIGSAANVGGNNLYYLWVLSPKEREELTAKVAKAKEEVAAAKAKLAKALLELNGRKPDTVPNNGDTPDKLDGNE